MHNHLVEAINPHLDAEAQLGMLLSLPTEKALSLNLLRGAKRLSAETFERLLDSDDGQVRRRVLLFAMANRTPLTPRSRARVFQAIQEDAEDA